MRWKKHGSAKRLSSNLPKTTDHIGTKKYEKNSAQQVRLEQKVAEMIAKGLQPYSVVDNAGFRALVKALGPKFDMPTKTNYLRTIIPQLYEKEQKKLANFVKEKHLNAMALTSDIWTSRNNDAFIDITGHCMDTNFTLKSVLLDTLHFPERHSGDEILKKLDYVLDSYRMDVARTKLFIVHDNESKYG